MVHITNAKGSKTDYFIKTVALECYKNFNFPRYDILQELTTFGQYNH